MSLIAAQIAPTLADLKAAPTTDDTIIYDHATFTWSATGDVPADDVNVVASDDTGFWIRQSASNIQASDGNTVQDNLDTRLVRHPTFTAAKAADNSLATSLSIDDRAQSQWLKWSALMASLDNYQEDFSWFEDAASNKWFLPDSNIIPFEAFGAIGDYDGDTGAGTDNTDVLQAALNWARPRGASLIAGATAKYLTGSLYLHYDAIKNPGAVSEPEDPSGNHGAWRPGRIAILGQVAGLATGALEEPGAALVHKNGETDPLLSCIGVFSISNPSAMGGEITLWNINLCGGSTSPWVLYVEACQGRISLSNMTIRGVYKAGGGVCFSTTWEKEVRNVQVYGVAKGLGPNEDGYDADDLATGIGWLETDNNSGGQINMSTWTNVNVYRWGICWWIGRKDGSGGTFGPLTFISCQASHADLQGVVISGGVLNLVAIGFQIEATIKNGLLVDQQGQTDVPRQIEWIGGYFTQCGKIEDGSSDCYSIDVGTSTGVQIDQPSFQNTRSGILFEAANSKNLTINAPEFRTVSTWGAANGTCISGSGSPVAGNQITLTKMLVDNGCATIVDSGASAAFYSTPTVIAADATQRSVTGTTDETTLATITVPGNLMGMNGGFQVDAVFTVSNTTNTKTIRGRFGGTTFFFTNPTTVASGRFQSGLQNRNSLSSQIGSAANVNSAGTSTSAVVTATVNTAGNQNITLTGQLADAGDTITLESYTVTVMPK